MKKIVIIFLIISSILSFIIAFKKTENSELKKVENIEIGISEEFYIPNNSLLADPEVIYPILEETANNFHVNIFRNSINYNSEDKIEISKYILLTSETKYFNHLKFKNGRNLNIEDTQKSNRFISTTNTNNKEQVGIIKLFGNKNNLKIMPLKNSYEYLSVDGQYFVEAPNNTTFHAFLEKFVEKLNEKYPQSFSKNEFLKNKNSSETTFTATSIKIIDYINYMILGIILLFLIYYIFNESRKIGILKMHGVSNILLWFMLIGKVIIITLLLLTIIELIFAFLVEDTIPQFFYNIVTYQLGNCFVLIIASLIMYIYISKIKINQAIKNKKDINAIFLINTILKISCSIILLLVSSSILNQYSMIKIKQESLNKWEISKDYGTFYPLKVGRDQEDIQNGQRKTNTTINKQLYPILNKMGSILIGASEYEEEFIRLNMNYKGIRSIKVNNNYLKEFPVYDIHNTPVKITEETQNWILLVPEKFYSREQEILEFFKKKRKSFMELQENFYNQVIPEEVRTQQIKIIWLKNAQKIFSFNPEVFKSENNMIIDPIIEIVTEKNSLIPDRDSLLGKGNRDPLKIKLINRDTALTYQKLEPELKKLQLDDNLTHLISLNQVVLEEIYNLKKEINTLLLITLALLIGLLILITQNLMVFFNKNQQKFIVHRLLGVGFFRTYKIYALFFVLTWILQLAGYYFISKTIDINFLIIAVLIILIETGVSIISLISIERKNRIKVLKGG
ncbi:DUF1430 domain-containing protein [Bacillus toyonensis]|uniref:DUF1430 domain-containing protein n=1 Tax=Bacillus toyonensis TaxID=155322 RepID=UPI0015CF6925|nr:DUF1430 domain-containing protein [Bacillus toyonensis]